MVMKRACRECGEELDFTSENFSWRNKSKGQLHYACKSCEKKHRLGYYAAHKTKYIKLATIRKNQQIKANQQFLLTYLRNHCCVDCGECDLRVLDFDHVRGVKRTTINVMMRRGFSIETIKKRN